MIMVFVVQSVYCSVGFYSSGDAQQQCKCLMSLKSFINYAFLRLNVTLYI